MHGNGSQRKTLSPQIQAALPLLACLAGNMALAFGPWFVRLADVGPVASGFWRIALAVPFLIALSYAGNRKPFAAVPALWLTLAVSGVAFAADLASWHLGILRTTLANATLFGNSATLMFPIYGFLIARAWPTRSQGTALALAALGAALLLGRSYSLSPKHLAGDLLCLLAGTLYTVYFIMMARAREAMAPLPALAMSSAGSMIPLLLFALALGETIWPTNWGILLGLALASQVLGQGLMIYAIGHLSPLVVGIALLSQPIVAGIVGWFVYHERLGWPDFLGAILVAIALVLVRRGPVASSAGATKSEAEGTV
ncbi:DMT family transporter [Sphingomonas sp. AOB5]|uniref:DMT family transporter n=1 Tax=Sphingomonas sp. AOB5 TaxID=3034017 RepID=UPI0023F95971|nr:DMT family transporter [Sphingomonas sp. AOB5]MDF7774240.1 DMT family transporter [Sphingomonas sp. AOB5]